jgi:protein-disulfide isomerase
VKLVWKDFPLTSIHPQAFKASEAAHCAADQGKYWEYHDKLFANQRALDVGGLKKQAAEVGLKSEAFDACLDSGKYTNRVREGLEAGSKLGVESTPTVFINGRVITGAQPIEAFRAVIDDELQRRR